MIEKPTQHEPITSVTREKMREKALAAKEGPWTWPSLWNGEYSVQALEEGAPIILATPNSNFEWCKPTAEFIATFNPQVALQLLDDIDRLIIKVLNLTMERDDANAERDELEARLATLQASLATEREAGYRDAIDLLRSYEATCSTIPFPAMHAQWLENKLNVKVRPGQTICAHSNPELMTRPKGEL